LKKLCQGVEGKMKAVITGANSFIGMRLAEKFSAEGWDSILVVRPGRNMKVPSNSSLLQLSMEEYAKLGELTGGCDCFLHLAWSGTRGLSRMDSEMQKKNVLYSLRGIESICNTGCGRVILVGSQAEYGPQLEPTAETALCRPHTEYGKAKLELSQKVAELCIQNNVEYKLLRIFSLYGPGDHPDTLISSVLRDMLANRSCQLTQCTQNWDYLYVADAVEAVFRLCSLPCSDGIYNIASGDIRPLKAFVEEMLQLTQSKSRLLFGAVPYPTTGTIALWPDVSKLKQELNWLPKTSFAQGIRLTIDWLKI